jgi:NADPH-dependent ferric siderophore reductase
MTDRAAKVGVVTRVEQLTPHMVRVVVGGAGVAALPAGEFTDHYVKVLFPRPGVVYPEPFEQSVIRETMPPETWPVVRTYTVRKWLPGIPEMWLDFVVHGDEGIAGPWAAAARPGDQITFMGPGGGYRPSPDAAWHLLAGDESALPAIGAALERLPGGARALVFVEVAGPDEEQTDLAVGDGVELRWVHRGDAAPGEALVAEVRGAALPAGTGSLFVHGEAGAVRELRRHLRETHGLPRELTSISGYWRRGDTEDRWQATKREWNAAIEAEEGVAS